MEIQQNKNPHALVRRSVEFFVAGSRLYLRMALFQHRVSSALSSKDVETLVSIYEELLSSLRSRKIYTEENLAQRIGVDIYRNINVANFIPVAAKDNNPDLMAIRFANMLLYVWIVC